MRIDALIIYKDNNGINNVIYPVTKKSNVIDLEQDLASMASSINSATQAVAGKVDKVEGKGLSAEDFTTAEKSKLAGIEAGATAVQVDSELSNTSTNPVQNKVVESALNGKAGFSNIDFFENSIKYHKTVFQGTTFYYSIIPANHKPDLILANNHVDDVQESVDMATSNHATVAVNAGIFNVSSKLTSGIIVQNGAVLCKRGGLSGVKHHLYMDINGRLDIIASSGDIDADVAQLDLPNTKWCVTGWGAMINNHTTAWLDSDQSPKSVIGQDDDGNYIVIITDGRDYSEQGTPATKVCEFVESLNFDARILYQLDGGGSVCFYNRGVRANKLIQNEDRHVANMLGFGQKTSTNDDLYMALAAISEQNVRARRNNLFYQGTDVYKIYSSHSVPGIELHDVVEEGGHVYSYPRLIKMGYGKSDYAFFIDAVCSDSNYKNIFKISDTEISLSRVRLDIETGEITLRNGVKLVPIRNVLELLSGTYDLNDITETSFKVSGGTNTHNPISDTAAVITLNGSAASTYYQILTDGFRLYIRNKGYDDWVRINGAEPSKSFPTNLSRARYNGTMRFDLTSHKTYTFYEGVWYDAMGNPRE